MLSFFPAPMQQKSLAEGQKFRLCWVLKHNCIKFCINILDCIILVVEIYNDIRKTCQVQ